MVKTQEVGTFITPEIAGGYDPLESADDLGPLMESIGDARYVLLGEATHGTHEFYTWRAAITQKLIREKGFNFIAVEGDWPDCFMINRFVKGYKDSPERAEDVLSQFARWPTWLWANWEVAAFSQWLRDYNKKLKDDAKIGFYGLDLYSLWESLEAVMNYLKKEDPKTARLAHHVLNCFEPYEKGQAYAEAVNQVAAFCSEEVIALLTAVRKNSSRYDNDPESALNAEMNSKVISNAEKYYRSMISFSEKSWNIRDGHMMSSLNRLMEHHGNDAKVVVWQHNTHVGDARATDMTDAGMWNVGQLVREQHEKDGVFIAGFSTYEGSVIAGRFWGADMEDMEIPPAKRGSVEEILHSESPENKLLIFDRHPAIKEKFSTWYGHRAIGVVFRPEYEKRNYVPTILSSRYDAVLYLDKTQSIFPLNVKPNGHLTPETYPFKI